MLTLEEFYMLGETASSYKKSANTFNRFFVKTEDCDPQSKEIKRGDVKDFIRIFKPAKLKALGGYLDYSEDGGCLGFTIKMLEKDFRNIEIVEGCTF